MRLLSSQKAKAQAKAWAQTFLGLWGWTQLSSLQTWTEEGLKAHPVTQLPQDLLAHLASKGTFPEKLLYPGDLTLHGFPQRSFTHLEQSVSALLPRGHSMWDLNWSGMTVKIGLLCVEHSAEQTHLSQTEQRASRYSGQNCHILNLTGQQFVRFGKWNWVRRSDIFL